MSDGILPAGGVVFDAKGNLYGATTYGGSGGSDCIGGSCGTVYELSPPALSGGEWTETILYNFSGVNVNNDGELPNGGLVIDAKGNLYGVTAYGGTGDCILFGGRDGCGTVYELSPPSQPGGTWTKTTIYSFQGGSDGYLPIGNLTFDENGNLYGATQYGGGFGSCNAPFYQYCGTIFELNTPPTPTGQWTEKVLYSFKGGSDGANPNGGLTLDKYGAIYGTTFFGGFVPSGSDSKCWGGSGSVTGCGTVFKLRPSLSDGEWHETVLHRFQNYPSDGAGPNAPLVADPDGDFYGTTVGGGVSESGTVFELTPPSKAGASWTEKLIVNFGDKDHAQGPTGGLILKNEGLYGTVGSGGRYLAGIVFHLDRPVGVPSSWKFITLCDFPIGNQAAGPSSELTFDNSGALYGTTTVYDHQLSGTVFRINPQSATPLRSPSASRSR